MTNKQRKENKRGNQERKKLILAQMKADKRTIGYWRTMVQNGRYTKIS